MLSVEPRSIILTQVSSASDRLYLFSISDYKATSTVLMYKKNHFFVCFFVFWFADDESQSQEIEITY